MKRGKNSRCSLNLAVRAWQSIIAVLICVGAGAQQASSPGTRSPTADEIIADSLRASQSQKGELPQYTVTRRYILQNKHLKGLATLHVLWTVIPGKGKQFKVYGETGMPAIARGAVMKVVEEEEANSHLIVDPSAITLKHYSFGLSSVDQSEYKLRLTPREKSKYLLNGFVVIQRPGSRIARVEGVTSKRISFWVSEANVVQEFASYNGFWLPSKTQSTANVRLIGQTQLTIEAEEYRFGSR